MFSYGEVFITLAAAVALFGPKDIPVIARAAGRYVGKAVGYIQSARGQLNDVMKHSDIEQILKERQEMMAQVEAIRHEFRTGFSISNPGPLTRTVLNVAVEPAPPTLPSAQAQPDVKAALNLQSPHGKLPGTQMGTVSDTQELHRASVLPTIPNFGKGESGTITTSTASAKPIGFQPGPDGTFDTMPAAKVVARTITVNPVGVRPDSGKDMSLKSGDMVQDIIVLPISAVSAGLLPLRTGPLSGGADLVLESVTERQVAFDSKVFIQQTDQSSKITLQSS